MKIADLDEKLHCKSVNVIGTVIFSGPKYAYMMKTGERSSKKMITLIDDSDISINLTLWGD